MFNSFYESMPPIELDKSKSLVFVVTNFLVGVLAVIALSSGIYSIIEESSGTTNTILWYRIFTLIPLYLVIKGVYRGYKFFFLPYNKKSYQVKYRDLQLMKRGYLFQLIFLGAVIASIAIQTENIWLVGKIIYFVVIAAILIFVLGFYVGINGLLKPYKDELRDNIVKQQQEMQKKAREAQVNGFSPNGWPFSPFQKPTGFERKEKTERESDEDIVRNSGGKVIDITDDINTKVVDEKKEDNDSDENNKDGEDPKPFSAF